MNIEKLRTLLDNIMYIVLDSEVNDSDFMKIKNYALEMQKEFDKYESRFTTN